MVDAVEPGKRAKSSVDYSPGGDHCGVCRFFHERPGAEKGTCELVGGVIDEDYWCRLFKRKGDNEFRMQR